MKKIVLFVALMLLLVPLSVMAQERSFGNVQVYNEGVGFDEVLKIKDEISSVANRVTRLEERVSAIEEKVASIQPGVRNEVLEKKIEAIENRVDVLEKKRVDLSKVEKNFDTAGLDEYGFDTETGIIPRKFERFDKVFVYSKNKGIKVKGVILQAKQQGKTVLYFVKMSGRKNPMWVTEKYLEEDIVANDPLVFETNEEVKTNTQVTQEKEKEKKVMSILLIIGIVFGGILSTFSIVIYMSTNPQRR